MRISYILMFLFVLTRLTYCQTTLNDPFRTKITNEAQTMADALIAKDYDTFIDYMPPQFMEGIGGRDTLLSIFNQGLPNGISIKKVTISNLSDTVIFNTEIQCTMKENIEMFVKGGILYTTSTLIGISFNNGAKWYFIEGGEKTLQQLKITYPNLSDRLKVTPQGKPFFMKE